MLALSSCKKSLFGEPTAADAGTSGEERLLATGDTGRRRADNEYCRGRSPRPLGEGSAVAIGEEKGAASSTLGSILAPRVHVRWLRPTMGPLLGYTIHLMETGDTSECE